MRRVCKVGSRLDKNECPLELVNWSNVLVAFIVRPATGPIRVLASSAWATQIKTLSGWLRTAGCRLETNIISGSPLNIDLEE